MVAFPMFVFVLPAYAFVGWLISSRIPATHKAPYFRSRLNQGKGAILDMTVIIVWFFSYLFHQGGTGMVAMILPLVFLTCAVATYVGGVLGWAYTKLQNR